MLIEVASGDRRTLHADPDADLFAPKIAPDGSRVAYVRELRSTPATAAALSVEVVDVASGEVSRPAQDWDRWPNEVAWLPDGSGLLVAADQDGRGPIFVVDLAGGPYPSAHRRRRHLLEPGGGAGRLHRLRHAHQLPDPAAPGADRSAPARAPASPSFCPRRHPCPSYPVRWSTSGPRPLDGVPGPWLAGPAARRRRGSSGPAAALDPWWAARSWNAWSWRWTPWVMVAAGYAVLLPDPALSTGYGQEFVQRGWGAWGGAPYTDLLAITDEVEGRAEIDATRTAAMGGSFGGYMANWVAGHTDRFKAIVTHASLWSLDEFGGTTDGGNYWDREMTPEMTATNSPHLFVSQITTPMLVVHGDKDYRVPISQGIRLWYDLLSKSGLPARDDGTHRPPVPVFPFGEPLGPHPGSRRSSGTGWFWTSWPSTCSARRPRRCRHCSAARRHLVRIPSDSWLT